MIKLAVVTATRAEYGLLRPVINELRKYENHALQVILIVSGTHLIADYGYTISEIESDGVRIDYKIKIPVNSATEYDISKNQANALVQFTELFSKQKFDAVILLGDRYETLSFAIAAGNTRTPVFHLCGGDTTEGALDEWIRHAITKISYLHFVTNEESRKRVIQLGENPARVFNYGSTSIDNILTIAALNKNEALSSIGMDDCMYALCTYHPVTMENADVDNKILCFVKAIEKYSRIVFIVTKSNADQGGARINELLDQAEKQVKNLYVFTSLGMERYLSLMRYAVFVMGNSSSGIIETPVFQIPTINIGDRQKGRLQSESIINCDEDTDSICKSIDIALSQKHRELCREVISPYGDGHAAEKIAGKMIEAVRERIDLKKVFYDLKIKR